MAAFRPTKREIVIVAAFLLVVVLLTGAHNSVQYTTGRLSGFASSKAGYATVSEQKSLDTSLDRPRLEWAQGDIPETELVQHAPGQS